ncbi:exo-beta-1 3-glucanase [Fusarium beomiforme]|uniref:Exo-beta-1 3-glucanase n=1 Tax=Fusarium beomiforme TaxID=44412 RepID=A0A9P5E274_9HYPO|nr:exo-beta-1 3-glucanase [Fusarium beomiforme]
MKATRIFLFATSLLPLVQGYWLPDLKHQGLAPYASNNYTVFRNVKDYGAKGDGTTDDAAAINKAIMAGNRCGRDCIGTTTTPALVYFPSGTYLLSKPVLPAYFTQMIGDPTNPPTLKASADFDGFGVIDGDPYYGSGLNWGSTTVFFRQIRNFVIDTRAIPGRKSAVGIHWPTAQATSLQNIVFNMPTDQDVAHTGLYIEEGSAGFITDLTFNGGSVGAAWGNQQYTTRNLVFNDCKTAVKQFWNWGWTYIGLSINNCGVGLDVTSSDPQHIATGSITLLDSTIKNTPVGISASRTNNSSPTTAGSMILENIVLQNVPVAVKGPGGTLLAGGDTTIKAWGTGHEYTPSGPKRFEAEIPPSERPAALLDDSNYRVISKPQYVDLKADDIVTARSFGAVGDGKTDDTSALQKGVNSAAQSGKLFWLDHGMYKVTDTITVPPGARIAGEAYPTIISAGSNFANQNSPRVVLKVGVSSGQSGHVELSDFILSTRGSQAGAILIEWNLSSESGRPSGMWDVHTRIGGFVGSDLQAAQCAKQPGRTDVPEGCIAAFMSMHVTKQASGLCMENCWLWTADHDIDGSGQLDIYAGRGLLVESTEGTFWLYGTSSEHHALHQYNLVNTKNIFMGQIQTETAYYQPAPVVPAPFKIEDRYHDPSFPTDVKSGWALRVKDSSDILVYGAGLYSFFDKWVSDSCVTIAEGSDCQTRITSIESSSKISIYNLNTVGTTEMITQDGHSVAKFSDNKNAFASTVALFRN